MIEFDKISDFFSEFYDFKLSDERSYFDFHLHTTQAKGRGSLPFYLEFLKGKHHLIAITDHNEIKGAISVAEAGINNVPAIELACKDGFEILIYFRKLQDLEDFYIREVECRKHFCRMERTDKDIEYYLDALVGRDCYLSIPHINGLAENNYLQNKPYIKKILTRVDAIETYNHSLPKNRNINAQIIRRSYELDATFGSDSCTNRDIESFYRLLNQELRRQHKWMESLKLPLGSDRLYKSSLSHKGNSD
ncbi:PHP domain-containing protein [Photobacterium sp. J15]|uniref:PHP domain-containing protein n=1 Tax=Photobacterium sp. J15 TaxID=265901 RepID=UPI0007E47804|nr:hypothetical protein [Photobacterium sp. J15]